MAEQTIDYRSYLLRLWHAREEGQDVWRASLQDPQSGERISFTTVEALFAFLEKQLGSTPDAREDVGAGARAGPGPVPRK